MQINNLNTKKNKHPVKINNILLKLIKKVEAKSKKNKIFYQTIWEKIVGDQIAKYTYIDQIKGAKLYIYAESSVWMNELTFLKESIKIKTQKLFSDHDIHIDEIIFKNR